MKMDFGEMFFDLVTGVRHFIVGVLCIIGFTWALSIFGWFFVLEAFVEDGLRIGRYNPLIINKWVVLGINSAIHMLILVSYILINYVEFNSANGTILKTKGRRI